MKHYILIIFLIIFFEYGYSQTKIPVENSRIASESFVDKLVGNGVDTIMVYEANYELDFHTFKPADSCKSAFCEYDLYVVWIDNSRCYLKKFNNCFCYKEIEIDKFDFYSYYLANKSEIDTAIIEPPTESISYDSTGKEKERSAVVVFDGSYDDLVFKINGKTDSLSYSLSCFSSIDNPVFYRKNISSKRYLLLSNIKRHLKEIGAKNTFVRE